MRELLVVAPVGLALGFLAGFAERALLFLVLCASCLFFFGLLGLTASYMSTSTQRANRRGTSLAALFLLGGPLFDWMLMAVFPSHGSHPATFVPVATFLSPLAAASAISWGQSAWLGTVALYALGSWLLWRHLCRRAQQARVG